MGSNQTCKNCFYWTSAKPSLGDGLCRRNPPHPARIYDLNGLDHERTCEWPATDMLDWCGEHKPKKASDANG
jgi:hypothetical protein